MASKQNKSISISKYKGKREMNIGIFLFAIVFIYLVVTVIMYFTGRQISVYEVREGSIVNDHSFTGLILREETPVTAEAGGYVSYYQNENTKVKKGANIYALSEQVLNSDNADAENETSSGALNPEVQSGIVVNIQNFNQNFNGENYSAVYSLKNEVTTSLQNALSETRTDQLSSVIESSGQKVVSYGAQKDGIVTYSVDGYESLTKDSFTESDFDRSDYESTTLEDQMKVSAGDPVYKMITSENWSVIVQLDDDTAKAMMEEETTSVRVRIDKDSETLWAGFSMIERGGKSYGCLDFTDSMIRYANERYLSVELILEDESGLKIPKSSVVEEDFFVIPQEYLTTGGNSSSQGVMVRNADGSARFQEVHIYNTTEEGEVYVSRDDMDTGSVLAKPESADTYTVEQTGSLSGVYNINRGYAVFRKVTILCESDEYYIVQEGDSYGLSNYDHIVQDGNSVNSEDVVFQ